MTLARFTLWFGGAQFDCEVPCSDGEACGDIEVTAVTHVHNGKRIRTVLLETFYLDITELRHDQISDIEVAIQAAQLEEKAA